jgi:transcriptional regulator with PAS, ATPase and Fis domain
VRIISATNINLEDAVKNGKFREDLYYRLYVIPIFIPPLRNRKEDLSLLVKNIIRKCNQEFGRNIKGVSPEVIKILSNYSWPGNIRELENVIERAVINMRLTEDILNPIHIPEFISLTKQKMSVDKTNTQVKGNVYTLRQEKKSLQSLKKEAEKDAIITVLKNFNGDCQKSAENLGISIRTLYYKMRKYEIKKHYDFQSD